MVGFIVDVERSPRALAARAAVSLARSSELAVAVLLERPDPAGAARLARACGAAALQLVGGETPEEVAAVACALRSGFPEDARPSLLVSVGVTVTGARAETLSGCAPDELAAAGADAIVVDTATARTPGVFEIGGTGMVSDWRRAAALVQASPVPVWLAGGLTPANVAEAMEALHPAGVDVSSGVESAPGVKDEALLEAFVAAVRAADGVRPCR